MITIIDYGAGNIKSIQNMLKKIGVMSEITKDASVVKNAKKIILPGVGHFDHGMKNLKNSGLIDILSQKVKFEKTPFLGICLGAQLLGNKSEEGIEEGLAWIDMDIVKFDKSKMLGQQKIPHMGWNRIQIMKNGTLMKGLESEDTRFYFVHSFHMLPKLKESVLTSTYYGYEFVSAVQQDNIFGVQFHPEKSHYFGMQMLKNFIELN
ncbi:MAG: imidazole glycerol phosphate synthase subunit HisH [Bacteroidetes bacterium]|nr:MAG: imidazole glycerol phosphate synthase subunit HisH [Bacteroidota bacterium]MBL1145803.1 imidazole glycerol phosphate synthase subunit HisH [Bacteroidota bacterium]NOG58597.1 imidazole glycerol phosphate synthase subunit HisH [Bacteroidota bacterium]